MIKSIDNKIVLEMASLIPHHVIQSGKVVLGRAFVLGFENPSELLDLRGDVTFAENRGMGLTALPDGKFDVIFGAGGALTPFELIYLIENHLVEGGVIVFRAADYSAQPDFPRLAEYLAEHDHTIFYDYTVLVHDWDGEYCLLGGNDRVWEDN
jgi:hypothetical protein